MDKLKRTLQILLLGAVLISCGKEAGQKNPNLTPTPSHAAIAENLSTVLFVVAKLDSPLTLKGKVVKVFETESLPSLAVEGESYTLTPSFAVDSKGNLLNNPGNEKLKMLANAQADDTLKLQISLSSGNKWLIYRNLTEHKK